MKTELRMAARGVARKARAALRRRWVQVVLVLLVLLGGVSGTFWAAHHLADSVAITITYYGAPPGTPPAEAATWTGKATAQIVYTETINDMGKARALQFLLNHTGTGSLFASYNCPAGSSSPYVYSFHFSFLGIPVQSLYGAWGGCGGFRLTTLGITSPLRHGWPRRTTWQQLIQLTGMPDYSHSGQQSG